MHMFELQKKNTREKISMLETQSEIEKHDSKGLSVLQRIWEK